MAEKVIATHEHGSRTIMGTNWPVVSYVERQEHHGRVRWVVHRFVCNGVAESAKVHKTRGQAMDEFRDLTLVASLEAE